VLGCGIINGGLTVAGSIFEVVGVYSEGTPYWKTCVCRIISSSLVRRLLQSTKFPG
jgi:hypothetical protein